MEQEFDRIKRFKIQMRCMANLEEIARNTEYLRKYYPSFKSKYEGVKPPFFLPFHIQHADVDILKTDLLGFEVCIKCGKVWKFTNGHIATYSERNREYIGYLNPDKETRIIEIPTQG